MLLGVCWKKCEMSRFWFGRWEQVGLFWSWRQWNLNCLKNTGWLVKIHHGVLSPWICTFCSIQTNTGPNTDTGIGVTLMKKLWIYLWKRQRHQIKLWSATWCYLCSVTSRSNTTAAEVPVLSSSGLSKGWITVKPIQSSKVYLISDVGQEVEKYHPSQQTAAVLAC